MDGGLEPPSPAVPFADWWRWWADAPPGMTAAERAHAWAGFDKLRFYDAAERPGAAVYIVLGVYWGYDFERYVQEAGFEGGYPVQAIRSASAAEVERLRVAAELRGRLRRDESYPPPLALTGARAEADRDPFFETRAGETRIEADNAPFAETASVPVSAGPEAVRAARRVYLVHRLSWTWRGSWGAITWGPQLDPDRSDSGGFSVMRGWTCRRTTGIGCGREIIPEQPGWGTPAPGPTGGPPPPTGCRPPSGTPSGTCSTSCGSTRYVNWSCGTDRCAPGRNPPCN
jgi:hypothetical protein